MAKVKNQVINGSEETYTDASGESYYFGESFRHTITEGYPLPSDEVFRVVRRSPKFYRKTNQGPGTWRQRPYRMCWAECAARWNSLPEECPTPPFYPDTSSKKKVWDTKQERAVSCSSFDLYMRCCMTTCLFLDVTGPGGMIITGGMLPEPEQCFPCPNEYDCCKNVDNQEINVSIGYITQGMQINETQELSVEGFNPKCAPQIYQWVIASGGGTLSAEYGYEVTYTAPGSNPNCIENPVIQLICKDIVVDTLKLAINSGTTYQAYNIVEYCGVLPGGGEVTLCDGSTKSGDYWINHYQCCGKNYSCNGESMGNKLYWACSESEEGACAYYLDNGCPSGKCVIGTINDTRTEQDKANGCCPEALL